MTGEKGTGEMENEPVGGPEGTTPDATQNTAAPPGTGANAAQPAQADQSASAQADLSASAQADTDVLAQFVGDDGTLDADKVRQELKNYGELKSEHGRQSNEVGDTRKELQQYQEFVNTHFVDDPQNPGTPIHKAELATREQAPPDRLSGEQIDERLRELMDEHPDQYTEMMLEAATTQAVERITQREQTFSNPAAQEILTKHPDLKPLAEKIASERRIPIDSALKEAIGEKFLNFASGANAGGITPTTPTVNLGTLTTPARTFMAPTGTTPEAKPKSNLTTAQQERAKEYGIPLEKLEPYAREEGER